MENFKYRKAHTDDIMKKVPEVLKWLETKASVAHISRYSRYVNYINDFYKEMTSLSMLDEKFQKLNWAFQELFEIVQVYNSFKDENSDNFNERIKKIISGQDMVPDTLKAQNDSSRDFLYELLVASHFKSAGFHIDFNDMADVVATKNGDTIFIECKRLKSDNTFEKNFKKAGKQLASRAQKDTYGLIFIDIASCILDKINSYEYCDISTMAQTIDKVISQYCKNNQSIIESLNNRFLNDSLGVCMTFYRCLWLCNLQVNYFKKIQVQTSNNISDKLFKKLQELLV
jgi:hypothetical protein